MNWQDVARQVQYSGIYAQQNQFDQNYYNNQFAQYGQYAQQQSQQVWKEPQKMDGSKFLVICGSEQFNAETIELAQKKAEELAHKHSVNVYVLKPFLLVAPKRDVVVTNL